MLRSSFSALAYLRLTLCGGMLLSVGCDSDGKPSSNGGGTAGTTDDGNVENTAPTAPEVAIEPAEPTTESSLEAVILTDASDADGDPLTLAYTWLVDGVVAPDYTDASVPAAATAKGEVWEVQVVADDGTASSDAASASTTILNTLPELDGAVAAAEGSTARDTLTCTPGVTTDVDGDAVSLGFEWFVDGAAVAEGETLAPGFHIRGSEVFCRVTPNDGEADGASVDSNVLVIGDSAPELVDVQIAPASPTTSDTLTSTVTVDEPDGDPLSYTYSWYVNDGLVTTGSDSLSGVDYFSSGDRVYAEVMVSDGTSDSATVRSNEVVVVNAAPEGDSVSISPTGPYTNDTLVATAVGSDDDGDSITWTYAWYVNSVEVSGETDASLDGASHFDRDDEVYVVATPSDGTDSGSPVTSSTVTVLNTAPEDAVIAIDPSAPQSSEDLFCDIITPSTDADDDSISYTFSWVVDGAPFTGASTTTYTGDTIDAGDTTDGEIWTCAVTPTDGTDAASTVTDSVTVVDWTGARELTTCGGTGMTGPLQTDCDTEYSGTTLDGEVQVSGGIQEWTVPADGDYVITAYGAQGASAQTGYVGGWGALAEGTFTLSTGDVLYIAIGQEGIGEDSGTSGGGGGGTFVVNAAGDPLVVAGGGGGTRAAASQDGCDAQAGEYAGRGEVATTSSCLVKTTDLGLGGIITGDSWGSGGAGFYSDGEDERFAYPSWGGDGGYAWASGLGGGEGNTDCGISADGGFGGGGSGNGCHGGGGGGGYSGGDGGLIAGGGASYVDSSAADATTTGAYNEGEGWVVIDLAD